MNHEQLFDIMAEQNVRQEILCLEVGEWARFPLFRYDYVLSCRTRLAKKLNRVYSSSTENGEVVITRMEDKHEAAVA